jgi:hypothetical protein
MAGTVEDNTTAVDWRLASSSAHTIDDLFQILVCARDIPAPIAKKQITKFLQLNKLQIDFHVRGGARKIAPTRLVTEEEREAFREKAAETPKEERAALAAATFDHLYEVAPPEGITGRVDFQSWEWMFYLRIDKGRLIVESRRPLDFPWDAYSFTIANWSLINELWPPPVTTFVPPALAGEEPPTTPPESAPLATPSPAQELRPTPITRTEEPRGEGPKEIAEAAPAPLSEFKPNGPQQEVIAGYVDEIYGRTLPNGITAAELEHAINEHLAIEDEARGKKIKRRRPSRDSYSRYIADWNCWNCQRASAPEHNP